MSREPRTHIEQAKDIVAQLKHIAASQCRNCGFVYRNSWDTHKRRFWGLLPPECDYNPVEWANE